MTAIDTLTPAAIAARLSGSPATRAAFVREAADAGVAEAQAVYGQMLLDGIGVTADPVAALSWFTRAAAQHHVMALNMVGRCYDLGWGTRVDKARAAECYRIAAERGLDWAMYNYATLLALGEGVVEDKPAALALLEKVAAMDSGLASAKAINFVGSLRKMAGPANAIPRAPQTAIDRRRKAAISADASITRGCSVRRERSRWP